MINDKELKPILEFDSCEADDFTMDDLLDELTEVILELNPAGFWFGTVKNFGWMNRSGTTYFIAETGIELLGAVLPKTNCSFKIFQEDGVLKIQNWHHDSPTGNEWYVLKPITYKEYKEKV